MSIWSLYQRLSPFILMITYRFTAQITGTSDNKNTAIKRCFGLSIDHFDFSMPCPCSISRTASIPDVTLPKQCEHRLSAAVGHVR